MSFREIKNSETKNLTKNLDYNNTTYEYTKPTKDDYKKLNPVTSVFDNHNPEVFNQQDNIHSKLEHQTSAFDNHNFEDYDQHHIKKR